jgi:hypothetical protein
VPVIGHSCVLARMMLPVTFGLRNTKFQTIFCRIFAKFRPNHDSFREIRRRDSPEDHRTRAAKSAPSRKARR